MRTCFQLLIAHPLGGLKCFAVLHICLQNSEFRLGLVDAESQGAAVRRLDQLFAQGRYLFFSPFGVIFVSLELSQNVATLIKQCIVRGRRG